MACIFFGTGKLFLSDCILTLAPTARLQLRGAYCTCFLCIENTVDQIRHRRGAERPHRVF